MGEDKKTILVVEDDPVNMRLIVYRLELKGYKVLQSVDGKGALEMLKTIVPDLILLDFRLPDIRGTEVFKKIRENSKFDSVKIIALTASGFKEEQEEIKNMGFDGLFLKPIDKEAFNDKIKEFIGE